MSLTDEQIELHALNDEPEDWNDLGHRKTWRQGYVIGYRAAAARLLERIAELEQQLEALRKDAGWRPIETAPDSMSEIVVVRFVNSDGEECHEFDYREDGCWIRWHEHAEHVEVIGGHGVSYTPPYKHWMPLPPKPDAAKEQR